MLNYQWWEWGLLIAGTYVAVATLVRLMRNRREEFLAELTRQAAEEQRRQAREEKLRQKRERDAQRLKVMQQSRRKAA